jgi:heme A synthase
MTIVTHALSPVLVASTVNVFSLKYQRKIIFTFKQLLAIGMAGIIPDILGMHFSLEGRYTSWTHTIWFVIGIYPVCFGVARRFFQSQWLLMTHMLWFAVIFHLALDSKSGGVALFYPYGDVVGDYLIGWDYWVRADLILIVIMIFLAIWITYKEKKLGLLPSTKFVVPVNIKEKINKRRFVLCGLLAGFILNLGDTYLNGPMLADRWSETMQALNLEAISTPAMIIFFFMNFLLGMGLVWLYLIYSVKYGRGYRSVLYAATTVWICVWLWSYIANMVMKIYPISIVLPSIIWGFFEVSLAAIAGSFTYDSIYRRRKCD